LSKEYYQNYAQAVSTNINIYVDACQFEKQINSFVGGEMLDFKAGYSITPIKKMAHFHPKSISCNR
jgi:hypothetical protein